MLSDSLKDELIILHIQYTATVLNTFPEHMLPTNHKKWPRQKAYVHIVNY